MPLVVPGMMTSGAGANTANANNSNTNESWTTKLVGKKLTDGPSDETSFSKKDLPSEHRIIEHGHSITHDYKAHRLNVSLNPDGIVMKTEFDDGRS